MRDRLDDRWLGFDDRALAGLVAAAGFTDVRTATGASLADGPFAVVLATGKKRSLMDIRATLDSLLARRILVLDGAMGTMIQRHNLTEADFRGDALRRPRPAT